MKLAHLSDVHIQLPDWRRRPWRQLGLLRAVATAELWKGRGALFDGAEATLAALVADAAARGIDHLVCTGDFTQLGMAEEMALARRALGAWAGRERFTGIAGNHDRYFPGPPIFEDGFPEQEASDLPGPLRVRLLPEVALVCIETSPAPSWPVIAAGRVLADDLRALPAVLAAPEVRARCALVLVHHAPLVRSGRPDWPWHGLHGGLPLLRAAAEGGAAAVLCGHVHDRFDLPAAPGRARVLCAGSSTERGGEGYWELTVERAQLVRVAEVRLQPDRR